MDKRYTAKSINACASEPESFLAECTGEYLGKVKSLAERVFIDNGKKIILLAGPSSSGKTTTASIMSRCIEAFGGKAYTVSLDDFYKSRSMGYPLDENGKPDYECVEALDIEFLHTKLSELITNGKASLPRFDFGSGERINGFLTINLEENDVIIVEGLHALNPVITDTLNKENLFKIYVNVSSRVYCENGDVLFSKRDLRFIRRMIRDYKFRSSSVENTFELWKSVTRGEDKYLFPFRNLADIKLDSFHPCEPSVFAREAISLLSHTENPEYKENALQLSQALSLFDKTDYSLLPDDSLLREFTG